MATRSTIALEYADGSVSQVYCHWDGYLSGVGLQLQEDYTDPFLLDKEVIMPGDMSCIGEPYTNRGEDYEDLKPRRFQSFDEYTAECQQEEYDYILRPVEGKAVWFVRCFATNGKWVTMEEAAEMEQCESEDF